MALVFATYEGDLGPRPRIIDLWTYEEFGNSDALLDIGVDAATNQADVLVLGDAAERTVERFREATDRIELLDAAETVLARLRELVDRLAVADSTERLLERSREASDVLEIPDTVERFLERFRETADGLELPDAHERTAERPREDQDAAVGMLDGVDVIVVSAAPIPPEPVPTEDRLHIPASLSGRSRRRRLEAEDEALDLIMSGVL